MSGRTSTRIKRIFFGKDRSRKKHLSTAFDYCQSFLVAYRLIISLFTIQSGFDHTEFMRTEKAFYDYTTDEAVSAEILDIRNVEDRCALILDKTIFFPEGGGQPSDRGSINGITLLDVQERDNEILHFVSSDDARNLVPGKAELILDAKRRRILSAQHTGQHILSGMIYRILEAPTLSMHIGDETCTIDVNKAGITLDDLRLIEDKVQDIIEEDCPITIHLCPPEDIHRFNLRRLPPQGEDLWKSANTK